MTETTRNTVSNICHQHRCSPIWRNIFSWCKHFLLDVRNGGNEGRRDIKALANPNQAGSWDGKAYTEGGLIAMALGYQKAHYKGPPEDSGNENEAFDDKTESSTA